MAHTLGWQREGYRDNVMDFSNAKGIISAKVQHAFTAGTHAHVEENYGTWWAERCVMAMAEITLPALAKERACEICYYHGWPGWKIVDWAWVHCGCCEEANVEFTKTHSYLVSIDF